MPTLIELLKQPAALTEKHLAISNYLQTLSDKSTVNVMSQQNDISPFVYALILDTLYATQKTSSTLGAVILEALGEENIASSLTSKDRDVLNTLGEDLEDIGNEDT